MRVNTVLDMRVISGGCTLCNHNAYHVQGMIHMQTILIKLSQCVVSHSYYVLNSPSSYGIPHPRCTTTWQCTLSSSSQACVSFHLCPRFGRSQLVILWGIRQLSSLGNLPSIFMDQRGICQRAVPILRKRCFVR